MHCPLRIFADIPLSSAYWLMCVCCLIFGLMMMISFFSLSLFNFVSFVLSFRIYLISRLLLIFRCCFLIKSTFFFLSLLSSLLLWKGEQTVQTDKKRSVCMWVSVCFRTHSPFDSCWEFIWLFEWLMVLRFVNRLPAPYLFCTCKIQKCHLDFSFCEIGFRCSTCLVWSLLGIFISFFCIPRAISSSLFLLSLSFFSLSASVFRYIMTNKFHVGLLSRCVSY